MSEQNQSVPSRVADTIELIATRVRELSVDRAAQAVTWISVAVILVAATTTAVIWLIIGIFRALGTLIGVETAYAVVGLILVLVGAFIWSRRYPRDKSPQQE